MKKHSYALPFAAVVGAVLFSASTALALYNGPTDAATWSTMSGELATVKANLQAKMVEAAGVGIDTNYANVSCITLNRFQTWAQFDRDHPTEIYTAVTNEWWARSFTIFPSDYHVRLPFDEVQDCITLGNAAIAELQDQIDGNIELKPTVNLTVGTVTQGTDTWYRGGEPTFPSGFTWMPDEPDFKEAFGNVGGIWYPLSELQSNGTVPSWAYSGDVTTLNAQNADGSAPHIFTLGSRVSSWMLSQYPDIQDGRRNFIQWDIDHPMIRTWISQYVDGMFKYLIPASGTTPRVHNLANEPHFALGEKGWSVEYGISEYTKDKYGVWLQNKYGTVAALNAAHGSSYTSFVQAGDALPFDMSNANPKYWGVPKSYQGGPVWYDIMRFNMDRVNEWFQFCSDVTATNDQKYSTDGNFYGSNIKLTGWSLMGSGRDGGLDPEYLAKMQGILGSDLNNASGSSVNYRGDDRSWQNDFTMKWEEQTMCLDFYRSIAPGKPFYDSEWHALDNEWKDIDMSPEYVRASMWMAMLHGCGILDTWVWGRKNDGDFRTVNSGFIGETLTQPLALNAYGRAMKEMNAHADSIVRLVTQPEDRQFYVYYCEESAIQDSGYVEDLIEVYMAVKLLNVPMGFTTPTEISKLNSSHTVIVPRTGFILDSSLAALSGFSGNVVLVDPANCFTKTEHGVARGAHGISPYGTIALTDELTMAAALDSLLAPLKTAPPISVDVENGSGQSAYGVFIQQREDPETGAVTICLMNVSADARTITVNLPTDLPNLRNLITGNAQAATASMQPYEILLLSADDGVAPPPPPVPWIEFVSSEGYSPGDLNNHSDWSAKSTIDVDPSGSGTVAVPGFDVAIFADGEAVVSGKKYAVAMDFSFTDGSADPSADGVQWKPLLNLSWFSSADANNPGAKINAMVNRDVSNYSINLYTNWGSYQAYPVYTSGSGGSGTIPAADFGIDRSGGDTNSALMRLKMEMTAGATANDWLMTTTLYNRDSASPDVPVAQFSTTGLTFNAMSMVYGGFGGGQSDGNAKILNRKIDAFRFAPENEEVLTAWDTFVAGYGLSGIATNDFDGDGVSDLEEFALGGNPTNSGLTGEAPYLVYHADNNVSFYHWKLTNQNAGISYITEWSTNLVSGVWTNLWNFQTNTPAANPDYENARNRVWGGDKPELFFRLKVTQP